MHICSERNEEETWFAFWNLLDMFHDIPAMEHEDCAQITTPKKEGSAITKGQKQANNKKEDKWLNHVKSG
jgi:hypothetical protein